LALSRTEFKTEYRTDGLHSSAPYAIGIVPLFIGGEKTPLPLDQSPL
jgi:hypothetical protein